MGGQQRRQTKCPMQEMRVLDRAREEVFKMAGSQKTFCMVSLPLLWLKVHKSTLRQVQTCLQTGHLSLNLGESQEGHK